MQQRERVGQFAGALTHLGLEEIVRGLQLQLLRTDMPDLPAVAAGQDERNREAAENVEPPLRVEARGQLQTEAVASLIPHAIGIGGLHPEGVAAGHQIVVDHRAVRAGVDPRRIQALQLVANLVFFRHDIAERGEEELHAVFPADEDGGAFPFQLPPVSVDLLDVDQGWDLVGVEVRGVDHHDAARIRKPDAAVQSLGARKTLFGAIGKLDRLQPVEHLA